MAIKQFPQDFLAGAAVKLMGATSDGTLVYIIVPAGGDTLQSNTDRGNQTNNTIRVTGGNKQSGGPALELYYDTGIATPCASIIAYDRNAGAFKPLVLQAQYTHFSTGNVGIALGGNGIPLQALHVGGNILASGTITPGSDKRLKKSIKKLPDNALGMINKLRPVSYTLREDSATALGFIADEVREIFPDLILEGKDDEKMLAMNYMGLTAPIVKAIQEMSATIEELKAEIAELKAK